MYRQVLIPSEQNNTISIPRRWYGKEIEVIVFPTQEEYEQEIDYTDIRQVLKHVKEEDVKEINKIFDKYLFSFKNFKFDRDEANNYD